MSIVDRILYNGNIHTLDPALPHATALAIRQGRILMVGSDADVREYATGSAVLENLQQKTVLPGLIDAHVHWRWTSESYHNVNVYELPTMTMALERVAERARGIDPDKWILGHGWAQDLWPENAFPTAADLDAIAPDNPVYLTAKSAHAAWVNTAALKLAGITDSTPDPEGGTILRDANGQATGILLEAPAMQLVSRHIPEVTPEQLADLMLASLEKANQQGLTAIHDLDNPDCLAALQILRERGLLTLRVTKYINKLFLNAAIKSGVRFGLGDDWIRFGGLKLFADGALGPHTALMIEPYAGEPDNYGIVVTAKDEMLEMALRATRAGLPTAIHAIGDQAVRDVLDVFEQVREEEARLRIPREDRRHRIEHVQIIHPDDVHRLAELDIIASMQPIHGTSDAQVADMVWGDRAALSYNARVQIDHGAAVAFGSDSPIEPFNPFMGMYAAVTRRHINGWPGPEGWRPDAKLTIDEAIRGFTVGAAYAAGLEDQQGMLAPDYYADLIVLDRDPYTIDPNDLLNVGVLGTMIDGVWYHGSGE
ncbi:MAG: amidohydrolase [Chloroflexota bacterium]